MGLKFIDPTHKLYKKEFLIRQYALDVIANYIDEHKDKKDLFVNCFDYAVDTVCNKYQITKKEFFDYIWTRVNISDAISEYRNPNPSIICYYHRKNKKLFADK